MPLSKVRNKERMRQVRLCNLNQQAVQPNTTYDTAHLDPRFNPMLRPPEPLPNCPDGRYRPLDNHRKPIYIY